MSLCSPPVNLFNPEPSPSPPTDTPPSKKAETLLSFDTDYEQDPSADMVGTPEPLFQYSAVPLQPTKVPAEAPSTTASTASISRNTSTPNLKYDPFGDLSNLFSSFNSLDAHPRPGGLPQSSSTNNFQRQASNLSTGSSTKPNYSRANFDEPKTTKTKPADMFGDLLGGFKRADDAKETGTKTIAQLRKEEMVSQRIALAYLSPPVRSTPNDHFARPTAQERHRRPRQAEDLRLDREQGAQHPLVALHATHRHVGGLQLAGLWHEPTAHAERRQEDVPQGVPRHPPRQGK